MGKNCTYFADSLNKNTSYNETKPKAKQN